MAKINVVKEAMLGAIAMFMNLVDKQKSTVHLVLNPNGTVYVTTDDNIAADHIVLHTQKGTGHKILDDDWSQTTLGTSAIDITASIILMKLGQLGKEIVLVNENDVLQPPAKTKLEILEEQINPLVLQIFEICHKHQIAMFFCAEYGNGGNVSSMNANPEASPSILMDTFANIMELTERDE